MPYIRRRTNRRRRVARRSGWPGRIARGAGYALAAYRMAKHIKGLINVEKKFYDVTATGTQSSTATVVNLSNIAEGNDYNQRDGNSILLQSIQGRFILQMNAAATQTLFRCIIFQDMDQRGTDPTVSDILETTSNPGYFTSPLLHYVNRRFKIHRDWSFVLDSAKATTKEWRLYKPFFNGKNHIKYQSTAGADGSNWEGALYMMVFSSEATNLPTFTYNVRLRYTDN